MHESEFILITDKTEILFFGKLRECTNIVSVQWPAFKDTDSLKAELFRKYPEMKELSFLIAVNEDLVYSNTILNPGDIVALMPPYAGG